MKRMGIYEKAPSKRKKYVAREYEQMKYPGERVQIDVKWVPKNCLSKELQERGERYYQYTAIDEYTRIRYLWFSKEISTYASSVFIEKVKKSFPFKIKCVQTDNGLEFTNRLNWNQGMRRKATLFEKKLEEIGIEHKVIKPHTPRHNGKVERSHRKDQERFYYEKVFYSLEDLKNRAKYWIREYNNFPMRPLNWLSPREKYLEYIQS
jgi:transposase InsO family protein